MADNLPTPIAVTTILATDDIGGVHYPRSKVVFGLNGVAVDVSATDPLPTTIAGGATGAKQDEMTAALNGLAGNEYEAVAASQTNQVLGVTGAIGDLLISLLVTPSSTAPGVITIKDGANAAITVFVGGASSITTLHPFTIPVAIRSNAGAWQITTGAGLSVLATGNFT